MKSCIELAADRGAADVGIALQHQHVEPCARQITRRDEPVVTGADDDRIVAAAVLDRFHAALRYSPIQAGTLRVAPPARSVVSTATSKAASVSGKAGIIVRRGDEPGLARIRLAQNALIVQHLCRRVVEGVVAALPVPVVARRLVREIQARSSRDGRRNYERCRVRSSTARMPLRKRVPYWAMRSSASVSSSICKRLLRRRQRH